MISYTLIDSDETLKSACDTMGSYPRIAMDLEADSMHHFKERVCLIQMADPDANYLVDPFVIQDFTPLRNLCNNPDILKVFHGADFDIRSLDRDFDIQINNLFDTEIACRFLGIEKRGLAALLHTYFGLHLDKRFQRTDWSQRPLSNEMIAYSINDVAHLLSLSEILHKKLTDAGRLAWAMEEFELQTRVKFEDNGDAPLFLKFKGAGKMGRENLGVLESLLQMRQGIAREKNLPLFKIMGNDVVARLTTLRPKNLQQLEASRILSVKQMKMYGEACITAIQEGLALPKADLPHYPKKKAPNLQPEIPDRIKMLKRLREKVSQKTGIEPGFLLNNATIGAIATARPVSHAELKRIDGTRNWQVALLGEKVIHAMENCR